MQTLDKLVMLSSARVDQDWAQGRPDVPPQSRVTNARTHPDWKNESAGKLVTGHLDWFSDPARLCQTRHHGETKRSSSDPGRRTLFKIFGRRWHLMAGGVVVMMML